MKEPKLSEQAYIGIKQLIQERRYLPGDSLPEKDLSAILHMSRTPIREALQRLKEEQVVSIKPHLGAFVATLDFAQLCDLYETREAVDGMIANILCKPHIDTGPFIRLKTELEEAVEIADPAKRAELLHQVAGKYSLMFRTLCGNKMLEQFSDVITTRIDSMGQITHIIPLFPEASVPERLSVLNAIIDKNAVLAEEAARHHVRSVFSRIMASAMPNANRSSLAAQVSTVRTRSLQDERV
jgi:DNA-binding GntR family transcriptional regulator